MKKRIIGHMAVLVSILLLPYWIYLPVLFMTTIVLNFFWEAIFYALLVITLYGTGVEVSTLYSPLIIALLVILIVAPRVRDRLRLYV